MAKTIFIAAHPRSGSTYFCRLLGDVLGTQVYLEIFHQQHSVIVQHLRGRYPAIAEKLQLPSDEVQARHQLIRRNSEYLTALQQFNPNNVLAFKVFPGHLGPQLLEQVLDQSQQIVVLRRNLLHSYISDVIAGHLQKWANTDTTAEKVEFSSPGFLAHVQRTNRYYEDVIAFAKGNSISLKTMNYEEIIAAENPADFLARTLDLPVPVNSKKQPDTRQDKRSIASDKVTNATEMLNFLECQGLALLNDSGRNCDDLSYKNLRNRFKLG